MKIIDLQGHFAVGEYIDENALNHLRLMRHDIYYEYCLAMSYKTWPLKTNVDLFVLYVSQSGIQRFIELQVKLFIFPK